MILSIKNELREYIEKQDFSVFETSDVCEAQELAFEYYIHNDSDACDWISKHNITIIDMLNECDNSGEISNMYEFLQDFELKKLIQAYIISVSYDLFVSIWEAKKTYEL